MKITLHMGKEAVSQVVMLTACLVSTLRMTGSCSSAFNASPMVNFPVDLSRANGMTCMRKYLSFGGSCGMKFTYTCPV